MRGASRSLLDADQPRILPHGLIDGRIVVDQSVREPVASPSPVEPEP